MSFQGHLDSCEKYYHPSGECSCGFDKFLKKPPGEATKEYFDKLLSPKKQSVDEYFDRLLKRKKTVVESYIDRQLAKPEDAAWSDYEKLQRRIERRKRRALDPFVYEKQCVRKTKKREGHEIALAFQHRVICQSSKNEQGCICRTDRCLVLPHKMPRKSEPRVMTGFTISSALLERFDALCRSRYSTRTTVILKLIEELLESERELAFTREEALSLNERPRTAVCCWVPLRLFTRLDRVAKHRRVTRAKLIRALISEALR